MPSLFKKTRAKLYFALIAVIVLGLSVAVLEFREDWSPHHRAQSHYENGLKLVEQHDNAKAVLEFRNALKLNKNMLPAWRSLARIEENDRHWSGVVESLQSIVSLDPDDIQARIKLAKLLSLSGRGAQALELTDPGTKAHGQDAKMLAVRAAIHYQLNDKTNAVQEARQALAIDPTDTDALIVIATDEMANGNANDALKTLDRSETNGADDVAIKLLKLKIFEKLGETQKFEAQLIELVRSHPEEIGFQKRLVKFYIDQHRDSDAEKELRRIANANPTNSELELDLVRLLYSAKGRDAAKQELLDRIDAGGDVFLYRIALADLYLSYGNFSGAEQLIRDLISNTTSPEQTRAAQTKLAEIYLKNNKIEDAEARASEILRTDPRNTDGLKLRATIRIVRGQLEPAIADLQQALSERPRSLELTLLLALAFERSGLIGLAEKQYAEAVRISNSNLTVGLIYARFLQRRGKVERAELFLRELSMRFPKNLEVSMALAQLKLERQDWDGAEELAKSIRAVGGTTGLADQVLGAALFGQRKFEEGLAIYQHAVDADPAAVQPMAALVNALVRAGKVERAIDFLKSAIQANPESANPYVLMGMVESTTGASDQALQSFKLAILKQPDDPFGYQGLANFYIGQKKFDDALQVLRTGLQKRPNNMTLRLTLAGVLEQTRQYEAAIAEYEGMMGNQSNSTIVANNLASLLADHRDDRASLEKAKSIAAGLRELRVPQFADTLGWISYRSGDYVGAVPLLEKAATQLPNVALVRYHLAMSYVELKQYAKASEQLAAALALGPDRELEERIQGALKKLKN